MNTMTRFKSIYTHKEKSACVTPPKKINSGYLSEVELHLLSFPPFLFFMCYTVLR